MEGAIAYAIFKNGTFVAIVEDATSLAVTAEEGDVLTIRSANAMGGFGVEATAEIGASEAAISDYDQGTLAPGEYPVIKCDRVLLAGLNTVVLPFTTTKEELGATKVLKYDGTEERDGMIYLKFSAVNTLEANTPYAVFVDVDTPIEQFEGKVIEEVSNIIVNDDEYAFVGTYAAFEQGNSPIANGDLIAGKEEFVKANGGNAIKAYRAFMKKVGESQARVAFIFDDEVVVGIEAAQMMDRLVQPIYNINGQQVTRTQKGVYIIDGKKVVVK